MQKRLPLALACVVGLTLVPSTNEATSGRGRSGLITQRVLVLDHRGEPVSRPVVAYREAGRRLKLIPRRGVIDVTAYPGEKIELAIRVEGTEVGRRLQVDAGFEMPARETDRPIKLTAPPRLQRVARSPRTELQGDDTCEGVGGDPPLGVPSVTPGSTIGASVDTAFPECGTTLTSPGVWYTVLGTGNTMTVSTCDTKSAGSADFDTKLSVYCLGCAPLSVVCIDGNDDTPGCDRRSTVRWPSLAGVEYQVLVHGFGAATGGFELAIDDDGVAVPEGQAAACAPPVPKGGCCIEGGCLQFPFVCTQETADRCTARGGTYRGDDSPCFDVAALASDYPSLDPATAIPDATGAKVQATIAVLPSFVVGDVEVDLQIDHTFVGDLRIALVHEGQVESVWDGRCGGRDGIDTTFAHPGTTRSCLDVESGGYRVSPTDTGLGDLRSFAGVDSAGDWTLEVEDALPFDSGTLEGWTLRLRPAADACSASSAVSKSDGIFGFGGRSR